MTTTDVVYFGMTPEDMGRWIEQNPTKVNNQDEWGETMLTVAANKANTDLITHLIDTRGANVDDQNASGRTALFTATDTRTVDALLQREANPLVRDNNGATALMWHAYEGRHNIVMSLLWDLRVIEAVDAQASNMLWEGFSALHIVCKARNVKHVRLSLIEQLLRAGANPQLRNDKGDIPLDVLRRHHSYCKESIFLLKRATNNDRTYILSRARHQINLLRFLREDAQGGDDATTMETKQATCMKHAPVFLKKHMAADGALPTAVTGTKRHQRPWGQSAADAAEQEQQFAVLHHILGMNEEGEAGKVLVENGKEGAVLPNQGISEDVFAEFLLMMGEE